MKHSLIGLTMLIVGIVAGMALASPIARAQAYWSEPLPTYPFLVLIADPSRPDAGDWIDLKCTQVQSDDPAQADISSALQAGQWFIGVDVGAHQAAHKLLCSQGWI